MDNAKKAAYIKMLLEFNQEKNDWTIAVNRQERAYLELIGEIQVDDTFVIPAFPAHRLSRRETDCVFLQKTRRGIILVNLHHAKNLMQIAEVQG